MCLAVPGKITKIDNETATIDYGVEQREAAIIGEFKVGDYVIVTGKVVVQKIPEQEAKEALKFYNEAVSKR